MDGAVFGVIAAVFVWLLAGRLGWDPAPGRPYLMACVGCFALAIAAPGMAVETRITGWALFGTIAAAAGAALLFLAVLRFVRLDRPEDPPPGVP